MPPERQDDEVFHSACLSHEGSDVRQQIELIQAAFVDGGELLDLPVQSDILVYSQDGFDVEAALVLQGLLGEGLHLADEGVGVAEGEVQEFGELLGLLGVVLGEEDLDELI